MAATPKKSITQSVRFRFVGMTTATIVLILGLQGLLQYSLRHGELIKAVESNMTLMASRLGANLADPLWNLNPSVANQALVAEFSNPAVYGIVVKEQGGKVFSAVRRSDQGTEPWDQPQPPPQALSRTADILREGGKIGEVLLSYDYENTKIELFKQAVFTAAEIFVTAVLLSLTLVFLLERLVVRPILAVRGEIDTLAAGDADLTRRLHLKRKDEIGDLVSGFNRFVAKLAEIVSGLKASQTQLGGVGEVLARASQETAGATNQIQANIESVRTMTDRQLKSAEGALVNSQALTSQIDQLDSMIENQTTGNSQASASIEQMISNIGSVTRSVEKMAAHYEALARNAENGLAQQAIVNEKVRDIAVQSELLAEANQTIAAIAAQTNLLAMNAAIEAAHAGEAGKGFSVVADEIRKLAETATEQSKTVGSELSAIRQGIEAVVVLSKDSEQALDQVAQSIGDTENLVREINQAMIEQQGGSTQVLEALQRLVNAQATVRAEAKSMTAGNAKVLAEIQLLEQASAQIAGSMDEMAQGVTEVSKSAVTVSGLAEETRAIIRSMDSAIGAFKA